LEPGHRALSVTHCDELGLIAAIPAEEAAVVRFAILRHSVADRGSERLAAKLSQHPDARGCLADPVRTIRVLCPLKNPDALDRIRLGFGECADPRQLRHPETLKMIDFAAALHEVRQ